MANEQEKQQQQSTEPDNEGKRHFITDLTDEELKKQQEAEEEKAKERAKKRKLIPPFVMLLAGAIVSITLRIMKYELKDMLIILLCVLIGFYFAGSVIKWMLDQFEKQIEQARMDNGEVIEKDLEEEDGAEGTARRTNARVTSEEPETERLEE